MLESTYTAAIQQMTDNADEVMDAIRQGTMLAMEPENQERLEQVEQDIVTTQEEVLALHKQKVTHQLDAEAYQRIDPQLCEAELIPNRVRLNLSPTVGNGLDRSEYAFYANRKAERARHGMVNTVPYTVKTGKAFQTDNRNGA